MVSIYSKPYTGTLNNINGVYNGLPFVVDSNMKTKGNFRYIAEIYAAGTKVAELRHSPDVSAERKGIFDISRIVENYLASDMKFDMQYSAYDSIITAAPYYVQFGEEYTRMLKAISTEIYYSGYSQFAKLNFDSYFDPAADGVLVGGSSKYNGWWMATALGTTWAAISTSYTGATENTTWALPTYKARAAAGNTINGSTYLSFKIYRPTDGKPRFHVGAKVTLNDFSSNTPINPFYKNSEWTIISIDENHSIVNGKMTDRYTITAPYKITIPSSYLFSVASYDNIIAKNQVSTQIDRAYALNLARQYEEESLTGANAKRDYFWNNKYRFYSGGAPFPTSQYCAPLTDMPGISFPSAERSIDICWGETYQISWLGRFLNSFSSNKALDVYMRIETWSSTSASSSSGTWQVSVGVAITGKTLTYVIPANVSSSWGVGDYVTANVTGLGTLSGRVVSVTYSGGSTYIFTDIASLTGGPGSIAKTIAVKYYDTLFQPNAMIYACGTWNLKGLAEFSNMTCYKYMVYPVLPVAGAYFTATGGVGPFNQESNGTNYEGSRKRVGLMTTFNIQSCCEQTLPFKVAWLNKEGGFDFYKFTARVDKKLAIERTEFYRKMPKVQSNNLYAYRPGDKGRQNWNTTSIESWNVNSDWLTQAELDWLANLYESPEVYLIIEGRRTSPSSAWTEPKVVPLNVRTADVELHNKAWKNSETGRLYRYAIEFESAKNRVVQRGGRAATLAYKSLYE